jgi:anti-sigma regulatory factor (Ser/Thr protein kinase)
VSKFRLSLPDRPESAQVRRHRLRAWLAEVGIDGEVEAEVASACSEAFNNAVLHPIDRSDSVVEITGEHIEGLLRLTVQDHGKWPPKRAKTDTGGYGLLLMRSLMDKVDITPTRQGTTVTLERTI